MLLEYIRAGFLNRAECSLFVIPKEGIIFVYSAHA
jgi:hypothetical protein